MELLGIGTWELVLILVLMVIVAGPKRMLQWSYTLGKWVATLRRMWSDAANQLQKELDSAGVDVQVPRDLPTRATIAKEIGRAMTPVTKPMQDSINEVKKDIEGARSAASLPELRSDIDAAKRAATVQGWRRTAQPQPEVTPATPPTPNGNGSTSGGFGTWSQGDSGDSPNENAR